MTPHSAPQTLDTEVLRAWQALGTGTDDSFLKEVITLFLSTSPALLSEMRQECDRGHRASLKRLAHKLRGSAANLGALGLAHWCANLESIAEGAKEPELFQLVDNLNAEFVNVSKQLRDAFLPS